MAAIDDALGESSVTLGPHQLKAYWRESDGTSDAASNDDSPTDLCQQFAGQMEIEHALDDAMPDPVTVTGSGDASGVLGATLNGREGLVLGTTGFRAYNASTSTTTGAATRSLSIPIPSTNIVRDDFIIGAVLTNDNTATVIPTVVDPKDQWTYLGSVVDAPYAMYVYYKRRWKTNSSSGLTLATDKDVNFISLSTAFWAKNPQGKMTLDFRVVNSNLVAEASATTTHSVSLRVPVKAYTVAFWGSPSVGALTPVGLSSQGGPSANGLVLQGASSAAPVDSGNYTLSATQVSNALVCMAAIALQVYERPRMDARKYFSPYNPDSPVYGWDRDTADVLAQLRVITATGPVDTTVFTGLMQGIKIKGRQADMPAVSKSRIRMNRNITLPMVNGPRVNCTLDWLATYLMARGGSFIGPAPNRYTRYWAPLYGSVNAHWDTPYSYNYAVYRTSSNPLVTTALRPPSVVAGKYNTAMYAQQTSTRQEEIVLSPRNLWQVTTDDFPHIADAGGPILADTMSLANTKARISFWVRGDAVASGIGYVAAGQDYIAKNVLTLSNPSSLGGGLGLFIEMGIDSSNRKPYLTMGNSLTGTLKVTYTGAAALPTDGAWHFYGFYWDYASGSGNVCVDGTVTSSTSWTAGFNDVSLLPTTDAVGRASGFTSSITITSHVPMSDVLLDFGESYVAGQWTRLYPTPELPGANAIMRPTLQYINAVAETTVVNAWDTLSDVARSAMAAYRCNEADAIEFLPLGYFGEAAQMTSAATQDTSINAEDFEIDDDPSRTRNLVTVKFPETRVDTSYQPVLLYSTATAIPSGQTLMTFALDTPMTEIHGSLPQSGSTWDINNLTSSQITTPSLPKANHYITANTSADGTGTVLPAGSLKAYIDSWDAGSVTLRFVNSTGTTAYLANNGDQVPYMQILGYGARASDAFSTARDDYSINIRRERALEAEIPWVQDRTTAMNTAAQMVNLLSRPRPIISVTVKGDPRRKPGQLITLLDAEGTQVGGTWRVWSVKHQVDGAKFTQDLTVSPVGPIALWDSSSTVWDTSVWGE